MTLAGLDGREIVPVGPLRSPPFSVVGAMPYGTLTMDYSTISHLPPFPVPNPRPIATTFRLANLVTGSSVSIGEFQELTGVDRNARPGPDSG